MQWLFVGWVYSQLICIRSLLSWKHRICTTFQECTLQESRGVGACRPRFGTDVAIYHGVTMLHAQANYSIFNYVLSTIGKYIIGCSISFVSHLYPDHFGVTFNVIDTNWINISGILSVGIKIKYNENQSPDQKYQSRKISLI